MEDYRLRFQELLRQLFQFESADLDFGIYRIMNQKRDVVERFIQKGLLDAVAVELDRGALAQQSDAAHKLQEKTEEVRSTLGGDALDVNGNLAETYRQSKIGREYLQLREEAQGYRARPQQERDVFNHLYAFFSRYYDNGDFLSKRRYSRKEKYAIPYNGEEVHLHWANSDQYYVKTGEYFTDYRFTSRGLTVHFRIRAADVEKDNVKGESRLFVPLPKEAAFDAKAKEVVVPFEFRPLTEQEQTRYGQRNQQEAILADALDTIPKQFGKQDDVLGALIVEHHTTSDGTSVTILDHHLRQYTQRNTSDFFIHKDLKGFLSRELDFYLKNEVLNLDELEAGGDARTDGWFQIMRVIKAIGGRVIEFLAQIEEFQKMLFEKRKFITETQYCITMGNIAEEFYGEIAENDAQWQEWKELVHIDEEERNIFTSAAKTRKERRVAFLKGHSTLVLDTKHFGQDFCGRLLSSFDNLDEVTDGLLVHSENFQALKLLEARYSGMVDFVYIDPPYNTAATPIIYKNDYKESSWLALMHDRLNATWPLQASVSALCVAIDDTELDRLSLLLRRLCGGRDLFRVVVNHYPGSGTGRSNVTRTHEYALFIVPHDLDLLRGKAVESGERERNFRRSGTGDNNYRIGRPNSFYSVLVDPKAKRVVGVEPPPAADDYPKGNTKDGYLRIYPIGEDNSERVWTLSYEGAVVAIRDGLIKCTSNLTINRVYVDEERRDLLPSLWTDTRFSAVSYGTNILKDLFGTNNTFSYPKSVYTVDFAIEAATHAKLNAIIMDYFSGSGTTAHATIVRNRNDGGERRFILVEVGAHFDTVLLPRIKKVTFTPEWKDGKPVRQATPQEALRSPRVVKYIRLESYEDALNNITFEGKAGQKALKFDDYLLSYMLKWETKESATLLNVEGIASPFRYRLTITDGQESRDKVVDLPETFAYLLGLHVKTRRVYADKDRRYLVYRGRIDHRNVVVIWRDTGGWEKKEYERDKKFVAEQKLTEGADEVFVNGDSLIPNARSLDGVFKARMFAPVGV